MANKYPQRKKCPVCKRVMTYIYGSYDCVHCRRVETNQPLEPDRSKDQRHNYRRPEVNWRPEE